MNMDRNKGIPAQTEAQISIKGTIDGWAKGWTGIRIGASRLPRNQGWAREQPGPVVGALWVFVGAVPGSQPLNLEQTPPFSESATAERLVSARMTKDGRDGRSPISYSTAKPTAASAPHLDLGALRLGPVRTQVVLPQRSTVHCQT